MKLLSSDGYDTDKGGPFLANYQRWPGHLADEPNALLELGIHKGGSLLMWRDYFQRGLIVGIDINEIDVPDDSGRVRVFRGRQEDVAMLDAVAAETAPQGYDVIIDDASHFGEYTRVSFWHLFEHHLKPGTDLRHRRLGERILADVAGRKALRRLADGREDPAYRTFLTPREAPLAEP